VSSEFRREGRIFRLVTFTPSHRQLIIRSDAHESEGERTRIEIYFGHVELMFIQPEYDALHLRKAADAERAEMVARFGLSDLNAGFYLLNPDGNHFIASGKPMWREAPRSFDDPSLFDFSMPPPLPSDVDWGVID